MDQNSQPPSGDAPERPAGERPWPEQPSQPAQQPEQPPGGYAPPPGSGYAPPSQPYPGQGYPQQPGYPPGGAPPGRPQDAPPPGYQPQGYPPPGPGDSQPPGAGGAPPPWNYPPPGPPQGYPPPGYGEAPRKSSGMPAWAWVVVSLVVVLIIGCVAVIAALSYVGTRVSQSFSTIGAGLIESFQPVTVASDFYTDLVTKNYDSAHQLLSSDLAFKYTADDLKAKWEALESAQGKITPS